MDFKCKPTCKYIFTVLSKNNEKIKAKKMWLLNFSLLTCIIQELYENNMDLLMISKIKISTKD
ncbi:unnamed protein product [Tenebrio molitor]|nr:unnamed protein product [Tenebrio molitor]